MGKVLVVDDEKSIRLTMREFIKEKGHHVFVAEDVSTAKAYLNEYEFDVVVADILLPKISGLELLKKIKKLSPLSQVIMITGSPTIETASEALREGAFDYLCKPVSKNDILKSIRNAMHVKFLADSKERLEEENRLHKEGLERLVEERTRSLRESEEKFRALTENSPDIIIRFSKDLTHLYINPTISNFVKDVSRWDFIGKRPRDLGFPSDEVRTFEETILSVFNEKENKDFLVNYGDYIFDSRLTPEFDEYGDVKTVLVSCRDITLQQKNETLKNQLRQAQRLEALGTLSSGIAHDFNNILFPIVGFIEMCLDKLPPESIVHQNLLEVINATNRAQDLVKQILSFSRQSENKRGPIQIKLVIKELVKLIRATFPATIDIRTNLFSDSYVNADVTELHQIIMNLCTNAYFAMRECGGVLDISLSDIASQEKSKTDNTFLNIANAIELTVKDTGTGIRPKILDQIFDPYFTTKNKGEGTGLGLSIVHGIVKSMNGFIQVQSSIDSGTTFKVYLPIFEHLVGKELNTENVIVQVGRENILVVDDEKQICSMLQQMLEEMGYQVSSYTSSEEALSRFKKSPDFFDIILTDITMPGMTGLELAKEINKIRHDIPIIFMTGHQSPDIEIKAKSIGKQRIMIKPIRKNTISKTIRSLLDSQ